jgi:hypothetical protein
VLVHGEGSAIANRPNRVPCDLRSLAIGIGKEIGRSAEAIVETLTGVPSIGCEALEVLIFRLIIETPAHERVARAV